MYFLFLEIRFNYQMWKLNYTILGVKEKRDENKGTRQKVHARD